MSKKSKNTSRFSEISKKLGIGKEQINTNLLILLSLFLLSSLIIMLFSIFVLQNVLTTNYLSQKDEQNKFFYWMEKVEEYPNAPDVLYNAAISANEVGKNETALSLLKRALEFDPLFEEAKNLQMEIISDVR